MIETEPGHVLLLEPQIVIAEQGSGDAHGCAATGTDARPYTAVDRTAGDCANSGTHCGGFDRATRIHAFALEVALFIGDFYGMITGHAGNRRGGRHEARACAQ